MGYLRDYKRSKLMKNKDFTDMVDRILELGEGEKIEIKGFDGFSHANRMRFNIYDVLNGLKVKEDFKIGVKDAVMTIRAVKKPTLVGELKTEGGKE